MREIGVYEAKSHLPRILADVERGETITITRHGKAIALLMPVTPPRRPLAEVVDALLAFRERHPLDDVTVRELVEEGRKY